MKRRPKIAEKKMGLLVGHCTHPGQARELNEDSYCVLTAPAIAPEIEALLVAADGMGGHQAGEVASGYVVETVEQLFSSSAYRAWVDFNSQREDYYAAVLKEVLEQLNDRLHNRAAIQRELQGMGTTATVVLLTGNRLFLGHVGDSRAYLLRNGEMQQLTADHSWVAEQVRAGDISAEQARLHPNRNILTRCLGTSLLVRVDRRIVPVQVGDILLLCTDGLTNVVSDEEIREAILNHRQPQAACDYLESLANQRGGPDNITVLVARLTAEAGSNLEDGRAVGRYMMEDEEAGRITQKIARRKVEVEARPAKMWRTALLWMVTPLGMGIAVMALAEYLLPLIKISLPSGVSSSVIAGAIAVCSCAVGILVGVLSAPSFLTMGRKRKHRARG